MAGQQVQVIRNRSLDPDSENWVVFVSKAQCIDDLPPDRSGLYLVLEGDSVDVVTRTPVGR